MPEPSGKAPLSDDHWSRARKDEHREAIDYYRERSKAPGVAEGGGPRNAYCLECDGVIPLSYDSRVAGSREGPTVCPHCGAPISERVQRMFNWVEIDQVPAGDARAVLPLLGAVLVALGLLLWWALA